MNAQLEAGVNAARDARRQEAADSLIIAARERALEVALDAVAKLTDPDGVLARDAATRLLSELELEARSKALMLATVMLASGFPEDHRLIVELTDRALL